MFKSIKQIVSTGLIISLFILSGNMTANATELRGGFETQTQTSWNAELAAKYDIEAVKAYLVTIERTDKGIDEINKIIAALDEDAPKMYRVKLGLKKLDMLSKVQRYEEAAELSKTFYFKHPRASFPTDEEYGDMMYQIVESLAKTDNLGIAYDIIQKLRASAYKNPNSYLAFIIDKSLIELYIETSDFKRALTLYLSVMNNPEYMASESADKWKPIAINEIAYLYNQLEDGENALIYLKQAAEIIEQRDTSANKLEKARALNIANRGRAYLLTGNYKQAKKMGIQVKKANIALNEPYLWGVGHRLVGSSYLQEGKYADAIMHLKSGIAVADAIDRLSLKRPLYEDYALALEKTGQHKSAMIWYKKLLQVETERQETIASIRSNLNDIEFNAFKDHQDTLHLHHELERNQSLNKMMLLVIASFLGVAAIFVYFFSHLRESRKKLIMSESKAQIANLAKSDFLANMSHEIRTPMNGVLGMAQVLERTNLTQLQRDYLNIIKQSGTTLLDLINDILDFSKIEADKLTLNYKSCDLDHTIQEIVALLKPNVDEKGIALRYRYAPNFPQHFILDKKRVRQVIMNLVGNAVKFTGEGHVNITVAGQLEEGQAKIQVFVSDTGIGIQPDQLANVFEKFTQAESPTHKPQAGTGLGLAISYKLSQAMNGDLTVTSEYGEGSTFTFSLTADLAVPDTAETPVVEKTISLAA